MRTRFPSVTVLVALLPLAFAAACATNGARPDAHPAAAGTAAWEVLVRSHLLRAGDADHSGALDAAEVAAIACSEWQTMDAALRRDRATSLGERYGFEPGFIFRGAPLGLGADARDAAADALARCLGPRPSDPETYAPLVRALVALGEPTSPRWDDEVRALLLGAFDRDASGALDRGDELARVPCAVWLALEEGTFAARNAPLMAIYGFADGYSFVGDALGIPEPLRDDAAEFMRGCGLGAD